MRYLLLVNRHLRHRWVALAHYHLLEVKQEAKEAVRIRPLQDLSVPCLGAGANPPSFDASLRDALDTGKYIQGVPFAPDVFNLAVYWKVCPALRGHHGQGKEIQDLEHCPKTQVRLES